MRKNIPLYMQTASHKVISIKTGFMYKIMHESCFYGIIKKQCGLDIRWRDL